MEQVREGEQEQRRHRGRDDRLPDLRRARRDLVRGGPRIDQLGRGPDRGERRGRRLGGRRGDESILVERQPTSANHTRLAYYLYLSGQTEAADQAAEQAKKAKGGTPADVDAQTQQAKALGTQLQAAIKQLTKQQQANGGGATGGGENPLGGLGGGLGGSG